MTDPTRPVRDQEYAIEAGWIVEVVNEHTCGTGRDGYYGAHEPGCGLVPVVTVEHALTALSERDALRATVDPCGVVVTAGESSNVRGGSGACVAGGPVRDQIAEVARTHEPEYHSGYLTGEPDYFTCTGCGWRSDDDLDGIAQQFTLHVADAMLALPVIADALAFASGDTASINGEPSASQVPPGDTTTVDAQLAARARDALIDTEARLFGLLTDLRALERQADAATGLVLRDLLRRYTPDDRQETP